jgi:YidC/Oxa1 family membrane protein insertase
VVFAVGGIAFPIGVLLYWTTSNLWTMSQQFYVIRNNPAPNTEAFRAKEARDAAKRKRKGGPAEEPAAGSAPGVVYGTDVEVAEPPPKPIQRQQPQKKSRSQRKNQPKGGKRPPVKGDQQ